MGFELFSLSLIKCGLCARFIFGGASSAYSYGPCMCSFKYDWQTAFYRYDVF